MKFKTDDMVGVPAVLHLIKAKSVKFLGSVSGSWQQL